MDGDFTIASERLFQTSTILQLIKFLNNYNLYVCSDRIHIRFQARNRRGGLVMLQLVVEYYYCLIYYLDIN